MVNKTKKDTPFTQKTVVSIDQIKKRWLSEQSEVVKQTLTKYI